MWRSFDSSMLHPSYNIIIKFAYTQQQFVYTQTSLKVLEEPWPNVVTPSLNVLKDFAFLLTGIEHFNYDLTKFNKFLFQGTLVAFGRLVTVTLVGKITRQLKVEILALRPVVTRSSITGWIKALRRQLTRMSAHHHRTLTRFNSSLSSRSLTM